MVNVLNANVSSRDDAATAATASETTTHSRISAATMAMIWIAKSDSQFDSTQLPGYAPKGSR